MPIDVRALPRPSADRWLQWWQSRSPMQKWLPVGLLGAFWALHFALGGFRGDHLATALFVLLYYGGPWTRSLFQLLLPFVLYLALYDSQGYYAEALRGAVRVAEPYLFDLRFFGIETEQGRLLPTQWMQNHTHPLLDVTTSLSYIVFVPVFLAVALYFRYRCGETGSGSLSAHEVRKQTHAMMWGMFWLNILCCSTYYWYPAAPPWYVDQYGLLGPAQLDVPPSPAGAGRFDALFGVTLFAEFYSRTPNVFGAIPSLHVAFPLLSVYFAFKIRSLRVFCVAFYLWISFAAVYLNHHYILDILWGSVYALAVGWAMDRYYRSREIDTAA